MVPNMEADPFMAPNLIRAMRRMATVAFLLPIFAVAGCEAEQRNGPERPATPPLPPQPQLPAQGGSSAPGDPTGSVAAQPAPHPSVVTPPTATSPELVELATWKVMNDPAAWQANLGKRFQFAGWVNAFTLVGVADGERPTVEVAAVPTDTSQPTDYSKIVACKAREAHPWEKFNEGDRVTVIGTLKDPGWLMLDDCTFEAPEGKPPPTLTVDEFAAQATADPDKFDEKYDCRWVVLKGKVLALELPSEGDLPAPVLFESPKWKILASNAEICRSAIKDIKVGEEVTVFGHSFIFLPGEEQGRVQLTGWYRYPQ